MIDTLNKFYSRNKSSVGIFVIIIAVGIISSLLLKRYETFILSLIMLPFIFGAKKINSPKHCLYYLIFAIISSFIWIEILRMFFKEAIALNINNADYQFLVSIIIFTLIFTLHFIILIFTVKEDIIKFVSFLIMTVSTIIFTFSTLIVNYMPLIEINQWLFENIFKDIELYDYFLQCYDGRIIVNIFIQVFTYPVWIASMLGLLLIEYRQYKRNLKDSNNKMTY